MKAYTGVGSRKTPKAIADVMHRLAVKLGSQGWTLRSGAAEGADIAFELGWLEWYANNTRGIVEPQAEIYVPWSGFEDHDKGGLFGATIVPSDIWFQNWDKAEKIAARIHPAWENCSQGARKMHTRNVFQVLGKTLDSPSKMLVCWADVDTDGVPGGGTRTAWVLAREHNIECFNLRYPEHMARIEKFLT